MPGTNKTQHGLNKWDGADKATRADFVSDNEIVESKAMWGKATIVILSLFQDLRTLR